MHRRTFLAAGSAAVLLSGCSVNNPFDSDPTPAGDVLDRLDPDIALAVEAVAAIGVAKRLAEATRARHPRLNATLEGLVRMHAAHHGALVEAVPDDVHLDTGAGPTQVAGRAPVARKRVSQAEEKLLGQLRGFALRAESGPFARLLAAMAASVAQHTTVLA